MRLLYVFLAAAALLIAADYTGPRPPKPDIPYLLHADHLVETEVGVAQSEQKKNDVNYTIAGASSPAKTPLAEPIFIMESKQISPDQLELYRLDTKGGRREVMISQKRHRGNAGPFHLIVSRLGGALYRIEADEPLENGEYSLSPNGSDKVFCFQIY
ncbi:MAG TPA: hypothetical protein VKU01_36710 [Bryobacteraceae bacterium]|nr:hypothetical protein [Bryobacteraceae bacterium]